MTQILFITGLSGAGKTVALRALEDSGCPAMDNLPLSAIPMVVQAYGEHSPAAPLLVFSTDIRSRDFSPTLLEAITQQLRDLGHRVDIVFLTSDSDTLLRRFQESRRPHPMAPDRPPQDAIAAEIALLMPVRELAEHVMDTTSLPPRVLSATIRQLYEIAEATMTVQLISFSFRGGIPREADMVLDMRFVRNPHYDPQLRPFTGMDAAVADYIAADPLYAPWFDAAVQMVLPMLTRYREEGRRLVTIAFGCTGGKHRSVYSVCRFKDTLSKEQYHVTVQHREL